MTGKIICWTGNEVLHIPGLPDHQRHDWTLIGRHNKNRFAPHKGGKDNGWRDITSFTLCSSEFMQEAWRKNGADNEKTHLLIFKLNKEMGHICTLLNSQKDLQHLTSSSPKSFHLISFKRWIHLQRSEKMWSIHPSAPDSNESLTWMLSSSEW